MSSSSATNLSKSELQVGEESIVEDVETEMSNVDDEVALQDDELEVVDIPNTSATVNEARRPSISINYPIQGEMERRAEERLLDERIRERYQRDIGDIFAKRTA
ncbi:hypothetical protein L7F22_043955 [Adiantum nelumboides]|nr:hypothetical protein [Adiantum nelumboides]